LLIVKLPCALPAPLVSQPYRMPESSEALRLRDTGASCRCPGRQRAAGGDAPRAALRDGGSAVHNLDRTGGGGRGRPREM